MAVRKERSIYFTRKEELDFVRLCTIHGFKKRDIIKDEENRVTKFEIYLPFIYLPFISGSMEKKLSNVARYTNSRRTSVPCIIGRQHLIKVTFNKK